MSNLRADHGNRARQTPIRRGLTLLVGTALAVGVLAATIGGAAAAKPPASNVAVNLDQCRNGGLADPQTTWEPCDGNGSGNAGWVNGNAGAANAHYAEGESISYRARLSGLTAGDDVTLIMGYDVVHGGHMALDYLTDKNRWQQPETNKVDTPDDPCDTVDGCDDPADLLTAPIPPPETNIQVDVSKTLADGCQVDADGAVQQPVTSFNNLPAAQREMEFFNADPADTDAILYVGTPPNLLDKNGDQEQQISVTFEALAPNPVLSWGAHIASRLDWGCVGDIRSAEGISGSPYHMRIKSIIVNGEAISLGNQDRSLSAAAVIFVQPGMTTQQEANVLGDYPNDSATLTGALNPTGSITFNLYSNATCTGSPVYTEVVPLGGATTVTTTNSASSTPKYQITTAGTYQWTASYPGDGTNGSASSPCGAEPVVVTKASPTASTLQNLIPNDTFTVSLGFNPSGNVQFHLYPPGVTCNASGTGAVYSQSVALASGSASTTNDGVVANGGYKATAEGTYTWYAALPADGANNAAVSNCVEEFTIDNDNTPTP